MAYGFKTAVKEFFSFNKREHIQLWGTGFVAGFILSFNMWGFSDVAEATKGFYTLVLGTIFVSLALYAHVTGLKLMALRFGYLIEFYWWKLGFFLSLFVAFLTNGLFPLFFTGSIDGNVVEKMRVGTYMPRFKFWEWGIISLFGPAANLILLFLLDPFFAATGSWYLKYFIYANVLVMFWSMLPLPLFHGVRVIESGTTTYDWKNGTIGFNVMMANRFWFVFFFALFGFYAFLVTVLQVYSFFLSLLVIVIFSILYLIFMQSKG